MVENVAIEEATDWRKASAVSRSGFLSSVEARTRMGSIDCRLRVPGDQDAPPGGM